MYTVKAYYGSGQVKSAVLLHHGQVIASCGAASSADRAYWIGRQASRDDALMAFARFANLMFREGEGDIIIRHGTVAMRLRGVNLPDIIGI